MVLNFKAQVERKIVQAAKTAMEALAVEFDNSCQENKVEVEELLVPTLTP